jgi:hypothetical protein
MKSPRGKWIIVRRILAVSALALAQPSWAQAQSISASALATTEATLDFCAQVDPKSAQQYWDQGKSLLQALPEGAATEIRKSEEYRQAYDSTTQMLAAVPQQEAARSCSGSTAANP